MRQEEIWRYYQNEGVDQFERNRPRIEYLVKTCVKLTRKSSTRKVLNIGVGNGLFESLAIGKGLDAHALDPDERAIERLRVNLLGDKAKVGYAQHMPFDDGCFDVIVMSEVLEHLDDDILQATLTEVRRTLKSGGWFIGTVPANENLQDSLVVCPHCAARFHRWGHVQSFTCESLKAVLSRHLTVQSTYEIFFSPWDSAGIKERAKTIVKKILSWARVGTYATSRNIFFAAMKS